jgi:hypothetical protein
MGSFDFHNWLPFRHMGICREEGHLALFKVQDELLRPSPSIHFSHTILKDRDYVLLPRRVHPEG